MTHFRTIPRSRAKRRSPSASARRPSGLDITEAGTRKLAVYVVRDPRRPGREPRARPAHRRVPRGRACRILAKPAGAAQGRAAPPGHDRRHRQRLLRRDPARRRMSPFKPAGPDRRRAAARTPRSGDAVGDAVERSAGWRPASSRARRSPASPCTGGPARSARSAATPCARCPSPTPACSTARPARPAASRSPTGGCSKLLK